MVTPMKTIVTPMKTKAQRKNKADGGVLVKTRTVHGKGNGVFAAMDIQKNARILQFNGHLGTDKDTSDTALEVGEGLFLEHAVLPHGHINHSCWPNARIDWSDLWLRATRRIECGEEITVHYGTFAYDEVNLEKNHSFTCHCGESGCVGTFRGFRYLDREDKRRVAPTAADHVIRSFLRDLGE